MVESRVNGSVLSSDEEIENTSDYTVINGVDSSPEDTMIPLDVAANEKVSRNSPKPGSFKCSQCFNTIEVGRPIYMRNDFPYCSKDCRELGVSSVYRVLFGSSIDNDSGFVTRLLRHMGGSSASISSFEDNEEEESTLISQVGVTSVARAKARSFFRSIMRTASRTSVGSSIIRTYSSSLLWGKNMTRNTSFNILFAYLPEVSGPLQHEVEPSKSNSASSPENFSSSSSS